MDTVTISESESGSSVTVHAAGELDLSSSPALRTAISEAFARGRDVVLDLSAASFIDSTVLAAIIHASNESKQLQRGFALGAQLQQQPRRLLELTHVLASLAQLGH